MYSGSVCTIINENVSRRVASTDDFFWIRCANAQELRTSKTKASTIQSLITVNDHTENPVDFIIVKYGHKPLLGIGLFSHLLFYIQPTSVNTIDLPRHEFLHRKQIHKDFP